MSATTDRLTKIKLYVIGTTSNIVSTHAAVFHGVDTLSAESVDGHDADVGTLLQLALLQLYSLEHFS